MPAGKTEEWSHAGHSLRIESWYPQSVMSINPAWYQGFIDRVLKVEDCYYRNMRQKLEKLAEEDSTEIGEFGQEEF